MPENSENELEPIRQGTMNRKYGKDIYTRDLSAEIVEMVENLLCVHGIKLPSPEDDERGEDNEAALYGSVYGELLDSIEDVLINMLNEAGVENYICGEFSGNF